MILLGARSNATSNEYQIFNKRRALNEWSKNDHDRYILTPSLIDSFVQVVCVVLLICSSKFFCLPQDMKQ